MLTPTLAISCAALPPMGAGQPGGGPSAGRVRRSVVWLVMLALVTAQALGLMHRVIHVPHAHGVAAAAHAGHHGVHWSAELFSGHTGDADCRLFDPASHDGGAPCVPAVILPVVLSTHFIDFYAGEFLVRWAALFDARGPPSLR